MLKVGVVGTRRRNAGEDLQSVKDKINEILSWHNVDTLWLVSGGCPTGADSFAEVIAKERGWPITIFYPAWAKYGKAAGIVRNTDIATECDLLIACVAPDRAGGTEDTIQKTKHLGKEVILV